MSYGKVFGGAVIAAHDMLEIDGRQVWGASAAQYAAQGWFPIVETPEPEAVEGYEWVKTYVEQNGNVEAVWVRQELPADLNEIARLDMEARIAALEEIIDAQAAALQALGVAESGEAGEGV